MSNLERVHIALPVRRGSPTDYMTNCPGPLHSNGDRKPSLHVSVGRASGTIVLRCFAGCNVRSILEAAGLTFNDICAEREPLNVKRVRKYYR